MYNGEKLQKIKKDIGKFVCRDGLEGCNPQKEEIEIFIYYVIYDNNIKILIVSNFIIF